MTLHCELAPQGVGIHGFPLSVVGEGTRKSKEYRKE